MTSPVSILAEPAMADKWRAQIVYGALFLWGTSVDSLVIPVLFRGIASLNVGVRQNAEQA